MRACAPRSTPTAASRGWPALHAELRTVDPAAAERIAPNDAQRIQRALEVWKLTGKPLSSLQGVRQVELPFEVKGIALVPDRAVLHRKIEKRFDAMLRMGLVDELKGLRKKYRLDASMPSMRAVGYRQAWEFLEGETDEATMRAPRGDRNAAACQAPAHLAAQLSRPTPARPRRRAGSGGSSPSAP